MLRGILAALAVLAFGAPAFAIGSGSRTYTATNIAGRSFTVYTYEPSNCTNQGFVLVFHGTSRDARGYRDGAIDFARRECVTIVAPLFSKSAFPSDSYQRGNIVDGNGNVRPESQWTTRYVAPLIAWARAHEAKPNWPVALYGHSAGGQFVSRVAAYQSNLPAIERFVIANPSTHVRASGVDESDGAPVDVNKTADYPPYGFDDSDWSPRVTRLYQYLARPVTIYIGEDDVLKDDDLGDRDNELLQGENRRERGENTFEEAEDNAAALGVPFNWTFVYAPNCGHSHGCMIRNSASTEAFGLD